MSDRMYDLIAPKTAAVASAEGRQASRSELLESRERDYPPGSPPSVNRAILSILNTWPSEQEAPELINHLGSLTPEQKQLFYSLLFDDVEYRDADSHAVGPGLPADVDEKRWSDLLERFTPTTDSREFVGLSDKGRQVGRLLVPTGEPPAYLAGAAPFRQEFDARRREVKERTAEIQRRGREQNSGAESGQPRQPPRRQGGT